MRRHFHWARIMGVVIILGILLLWHNRVFEGNETPQLDIVSVSAKPSEKILKGRPVNVLVISGGGIKGMIPLHVLSYLEAQTHQPTAKLFNLLTGTSSGAIIVTTLDVPNAKRTAPQYSAEDLLAIYRDDIPQIFNASISYRLFSGFGLLGPKYDSVGMRHIFQSILGNTTLAEVMTPLSFPSFDLRTSDAVIFRSWEAQKNHPNYYLRDILMGAVSAPVFFEPTQVASIDQSTQHLLIDGATLSNTPELMAYLEAMKLYPNRPIRIIALGTGEGGIAEGLIYRNADDDGLLAWATQIVGVFMGGRTKLMNSYMVSMVSDPHSALISYQHYDISLPHSEDRPFSRQKSYLRRLDSYGNFLVQGSQRELNALAAELAAKR